jgi:hypothetical protein
MYAPWNPKKLKAPPKVAIKIESTLNPVALSHISLFLPMLAAAWPFTKPNAVAEMPELAV